MVAVSRRDAVEFLKGRATSAVVDRAAVFDVVVKLLRLLENHAAFRALFDECRESAQIGALVEGLVEVSAVVLNSFFRERKRRANFDAAARSDVVAQAHRGGTEGFAGCGPIRVDDKNRMLAAQFEQAFSHPDELLFRDAIFGVRDLAHGAIDVEPNVHRAFFDEVLDVFIAQDFVHVQACRSASDAEEDAGFFQAVEAFVGGFENAFAPAQIVLAFKAVDADQRRDVADFFQTFHVFSSEQHTVRDRLEVAIGMFFENVPDAFVQIWFAAEERVVVGVAFLALDDDVVDVFGR